jgi:hypothetical protein
MSVDRVQYWKDRADLLLGKQSAELLLAAWRAAQPAIEAAGDVLNRTAHAHLQARLNNGPIPIGQMALYHPAHRDALDRITGREASAPGCETEAEAMARLPPVGPHDLLLIGQAWGCPHQGTPHSHADDPIQRWPRA